jgi:KDO2-lipid IV(A) lauroyltransferase
MVPIYGIRKPDGLSFEVHLDPPIAHAAPDAMIQALNDSLEAQTRAHLEQWFWIHRRWRKDKP